MADSDNIRRVDISVEDRGEGWHCYVVATNTSNETTQFRSEQPYETKELAFDNALAVKAHFQSLGFDQVFIDGLYSA